jgi:UDP-N-acetylglucosamine 1-carboxyvinyltransferase
MSKFVITGGKKLSGEIDVSGSKNAVLALMSACLLTSDECILTNVPEIDDVRSMMEIFRELGVEVELNDHVLRIRAAKVKTSAPNAELVGKFRGSILIIGSLLARVGHVSLPLPGGDKIGSRPIEAHTEALKALGAMGKANGLFEFDVQKLTGAKIVMEESSVTATENAILAAATATGHTTIKLAAMEPHVQSLCQFINLMGGKITGIGSPTLEIDGQNSLHGAQVEVIPDSEQAASLITLAAATKSNVTVRHLNPEFLEDYLLKIKKMGVNFEVGKDYVKVMAPTAEYLGTKIQSGLYPKLNSDFIPPMSVLAARASGESLLHEWMYENRQSYVESLVKMGADAQIIDKDRVKIVGPTPLHAEKITTYDLRQGLTLVIAALVASGESEISDIHHIDRGYERLEERLGAIGADIKRAD